MELKNLFKHKHKWREVASTGRTIQYSDTSNQVYGIKEEVIYQCRECKDIMVTTEVPKKTYL